MPNASTVASVVVPTPTGPSLVRFTEMTPGVQSGRRSGWAR